MSRKTKFISKIIPIVYTDDKEVHTETINELIQETEKHGKRIHEMLEVEETLSDDVGVLEDRVAEAEEKLAQVRGNAQGLNDRIERLEAKVKLLLQVNVELVENIQELQEEQKQRKRKCYGRIIM